MVEQAAEWQIPIFVMDCDVAAAFDHVSHHEIIKTTLIAAWIREYRNSETQVKLDDVVTPGIRRTKSVPQGDPCAADLLGAALDTPAAMFWDVCQHKKWTLPWSFALRGHVLDYRDVTRRAPNDGKSVERSAEILWTTNRLGEVVWCSTAQDSLAASIAVSETMITRRTREARFKALGVWITFDGTSQKNWLSVRYQRGAVSTRYDSCCVTPVWL